MGLRNGREYLDGLRDGRQVIYAGRVLGDVTEEPVLRWQTAAIAQFYDFQNRPGLQDLMSYETPDGDRAGMAFLEPRSKDDLRRRAAAHAAWADVTCGLLGRSPDYMNAMITSFGGLAARCAPEDRKLAKPLSDLYLKARRTDRYWTHTFHYPFKNHSVPAAESKTVLRVVSETADGLVVSGARGLATGAPFADLNFNYEALRAPGAGKQAGSGGHALWLWFAVPVNARGLRWLCRDIEATERTHFDSPLSRLVDEADAVAIFDEVFVPWEDVAAHAKDFESAMTIGRIFSAWGEELSKHQTLLRCIAKTRFILGLAHLIAESSQCNMHINVQQRLGEIVQVLQTLEAFAIAAVEAAVTDPISGLVHPNPRYVAAAGRMFSEASPKLLNHLLMLGASRFASSPQERTFELLGTAIEDYFRGSAPSAKENISLYRMAWDLAGTSFGVRQDLYERFFAGPPDLQQAASYVTMDKTVMIAMVRRMLRAAPTLEQPFPVPDHFVPA